jgi:hypothetical protein
MRSAQGSVESKLGLALRGTAEKQKTRNSDGGGSDISSQSSRGSQSREITRQVPLLGSEDQDTSLGC